MKFVENTKTMEFTTNTETTFLYVGDLHERATAPKNRKDDWEKTYTAKVKEIRSIAKKHNVKAILHGGDFFSRHKYDTEFLSQVLSRWGYKSYNEKLLKEGVIAKRADEAPIITPIGNHDLLGSSLKSYSRTSLSFLESIGFITIADKERPLVFNGDGFTVAITGGHYELDMDETKEPYIVDEKQGDYHIHIVHGMLTDRKWPDGVPHTTLDEVLHTKADLTIAGHDHKGFKLVEHNGKMFVNPGSPVRMSIDEIKRMPKVMLIKVTKEGIKVENIYLKTALPGEDVLDTTEKENKQRKANTLRDIKEKIREGSKVGASIDEIIKSIASESDIDESISQSAINRVSDKMKGQKPSVSEDSSKSISSPYYVESLELVNFGSHERTTFNFDKGLNVFVGATASGKTTCFRAFKWIYNDDGNSRRFIKKGKNFCEATISTSNGYIITRFINPKGKKTQDGKTVKNGYEIIYPDGSVEVTNTKGVELVRELLSYKKLNLESKEIDLNFLEQGDSWFFIGNKYTTTDRAKMIGAIHKTHFVDLAIKDLEADNKKLNQKRDDRVDEINKIQEKIDSFSYLKDMKSNIELINEKKERLIKLVEQKNKLNEILEKRDLLEVQISDCDKVINSINIESLNASKQQIYSIKNSLSSLDTINKLIEKKEALEFNIEKEDSIIKSIDIDKLEIAKKSIESTKEKLQSLMKLQNILSKESDLLKNIAICDNVINSIDLENLNICKEKIKSINEKLDLNVKLSTIIVKRDDILREVSKMNDELKKMDAENLSKASELLNSLRAKIELRNNLTKVLSKRNDIEVEVLKINKQIQHSENIIKQEIEQYKELLIVNGKCPICDAKIDKITAQQIANKKLQK